MKKRLTTLLLLILPVVHSFCIGSGLAKKNSFPTKIDVLFIAYDQGESSAFIPIMQALEKKRITYRIIALGQARDFFSSHRFLHNIPLTKQPSFKQNRNLTLTLSEIKSLTKHIQPSVINSGMACKAQAQILNFMFQKRHVPCIAFYDNFSDPDTQSYVKPFLNTIKKINEVHVPGNTARFGINKNYKKKFSNVITTGNPDLAQWKNTFTHIDIEPIRNQLKLPLNKPIILFAGGSEPNNAHYFKQWADAASKLSKIQFIVSTHPKQGSVLESKYIQQINAPNINVVTNKNLTTIMLCSLAQVVVTHRSSVGIKALYSGKPVIYIAEKNYKNILLKNKLSQLCTNSQSLQKAMQNAVKPKRWENTAKKLQKIEGFPDNPTMCIIERIKIYLYNRIYTHHGLVNLSEL